MRVVWCRNLEDVISISRAHGWLFHYHSGGKHYYYIYAGVENELMCLAVAVNKPLEGKYVAIDDEGKIKQSDQPILPSCAKIVEIERDDSFEEILKSLKS